jgi:uncharacterized protein (TIGR02391 family)
MQPASFSPARLESLCKLLADTDHGLTGAEIGRLLGQIGVDDPDPASTKWKRLYCALLARQALDGNADRVFALIRRGLDPARYVGRHAAFEDRRTAINAVLAFCGYEYGPDGKFYTTTPASTLGEAESRAHRLRAALSARGVHPDVLASCRTELVQQNAFHAVLEASKSVGEKLRRRARLNSDGAQLVDDALGGETPLLRINAFVSDSEKSEQRGFTNLVKGLFGVFRNPIAHTPRLAWDMSEEDALDLFSLASYVHRRIDAAH